MQSTFLRSKTWRAFFARFRNYGQLPTWGWFKIAPDPKTLAFAESYLRKIQERGSKMADRAEVAFRRIKAKRPDLIPATPCELPKFVERLWLEAPKVVGQRTWKNLWDAIVFELDDYRCQYCGRSTFEVFESEDHRRGLFLVVDHISPKTDAGKKSSFDNHATACWSCNTMKGRLSREAFEHELHSLLESATQSQALRGR